ncbi:MAG TPA: sulfatase [Thermoanaerobaculia bacterium]|nr:sulfatase [Thermoanaerobaculia bacterium]
MPHGAAGSPRGTPRAAGAPPRFVLAALVLAALAGCSRRAPHPGGPIVLITFDSLRADVVSVPGGEPALTPHLAALTREAQWAGRAIAASSWGVPAMASIFTGLNPWHHHALLEETAGLSPELLTLPKALKALGYETAGWSSGHWYTTELGYAQGFDVFGDLGRGREAAERLAGLDERRQFVWVHVPEPQAPYVRRDWLLERLSAGRAGIPPELPRVVDPVELAPYFDPRLPMAPELRRRFWAMYRLSAAWADERLGRLLDALRASGQWDRTLLIVTSNHGEDFGERGQSEHGGDLGRRLLEVPLIVKLPSWCRSRIAVPPGQRVGAVRIWATLFEAAGGQAPPAIAPSLFRLAPAAVLSELYLTNGTNQFSLVEGDDQLLWEARFSAPEPRYYRAQMEVMAGTARPGSPDSPGAIAARLFTAFAATPPLSGRGQPLLWLERWSDSSASGSEPRSDPPRLAAMSRQLAALWGTFLPRELTPSEEANEWRGALPPHPPN